MIINFKAIPFTNLQNFYDGEGSLSAHMFVDENNKIMQGVLNPGSSIGVHTHVNNSEIIFIISGSGYVLDDGVKQPLSQGDCHYCPKGHTHSLVNDGLEALCFYAVVPQHD